MTDHISDLIIRIKNASDAGHARVVVPYSKLKEAIVTVLEQKGFVGTFEKKGKKTVKTLEITILKQDGVAKILGIERVSKPSRRVYYKSADLRPVRQGFGLLVLSTPKGVLTDEEAKKEKVGGEALFKIW